MLELAIAEAYRPRRQPRQPPIAPTRTAAFATNPNSRCSTPSLGSRTRSIPSQSSSVTSRSLSLRSIISRRKRPDSVLSARPVERDDPVAPQSDISLRQANATSTTPGAVELLRTELATQIDSPCKSADRELPSLPPQVPLPPQEELSHFDDALQLAISSLLSSHSFHQDLASTVLQHMAHISDLASCVAASWSEFWTLLIHAAELIASVLPTGDIGARNVLVRSLAKIAERWNVEEKRSTVEIAGVIGSIFDEVLQKTGIVDKRLGEETARWVCGYHRSCLRGHGNTVRILTLGVSNAVLAALEYALATDADLEIHLSVLSSMEHALPPPPLCSRLNIATYSSSAIGSASLYVDILLLEFSCLCADGDMQCRNGALGTAACVKTLSPSAKVIGLGRTDSIASAALNTGGIQKTHESVPKKLVDSYITETGLMKDEDLERFALEVEELDQYILGEKGC